MVETLSSILFPLRTNIRSLQRWGNNDISARTKHSIILYDEIIIETGTWHDLGAYLDFVTAEENVFHALNEEEVTR